ncbi:MAG: DMT family transporter [Chloroflexi bacterium]|nr:DMT family transporter [Chloroflexota bacterium]
MLGTLLAVGSAAVFGVNSTVIRRGVLRASPSFIATISILIGPVYFLLVSMASGEILKLAGFTWQAYVFFAVAGVIHFALGRTFGYRAIQHLGSTRASVMAGLSDVVGVVLAITVLQEVLTPVMALGICFSLSGPTLIALKANSSANQIQPELNSIEKSANGNAVHIGLLYGVGSAIFWGSSAIFIKFGLASGGSSIAGLLISYAAAALAVLPSLRDREIKSAILAPERNSVQLAVMSGLTSCTAQMLRFLALAQGSVIVVSVVGRSSPIWVLIFGFIFNRKYETFSRWVILGNTLLLIGTVLIATQWR